MIRIAVFDNSIALYWDKERAGSNDAEYEIIVDGVCVGKTKKTHFKLNGLRAQTDYTVCVARNGETLFIRTIQTQRAKRRIDITKPPYCAAGDGMTVNTAAIQKAIDDCGEADCVYIPQGKYLTGALRLHSGMELYVAEGATLQGTSNPKDYLPKIKSRFEGIERECYRSLLNLGDCDHKSGYECKNVTVRGGGSILGGGYALHENILQTERAYLRQTDSIPAEKEKDAQWINTEAGRARGRLFQISNTENVTICELTLGQSPAWNLHFIYCKNILTFGCRIISDGIPNGDGWDPDSCEDCTVYNCDFETGDDAVAVKSGKNPQGNVINRPCKNVRIFDCRGRKGIALGSEMSGGVQDVYIWDCDFIRSRTGLRFRATSKRGGYIRNVRVWDSRFVDLHVWSDMQMNNDGESAGQLPVIEHIEIENIELTGMARTHDGSGYEPIEMLRLRGNREKEYFLNDIRVKNIKIHRRADGQLQRFEIENVKNVTLDGLQFIE